MASAFDDDPPKLNDLRSFAHHLASEPSYEDDITPESREEIAAYLLGFAARLRFPVTLTPTDESMRAARADILDYRESHLGLDLERNCRMSFGNGWAHAGEALDNERP